jgi:Icc-related predicted phosphoesterase
MFGAVCIGVPVSRRSPAHERAGLAFEGKSCATGGTVLATCAVTVDLSTGASAVMSTANTKAVVRLAAMSDLHYGRLAQGTLAPLFAQISECADVLLLCGDMTDYGTPEEAQSLARELSSSLRIPAVGVLGNHDYEAGKADEVRRILCDAGLNVLDGDSVELLGVGFAGVKGFCGGFGRGALGFWGEEVVKQFVQAALDEALKLETSLARLRTTQRVALLHYAPIQATVEGEPPVIFPFLGSSRLEEPLNRYPVSVVFHGHAHNGTPEGRTTSGIPVYNVSMELMRKAQASALPFREFTIPVGAGAADARTAEYTSEALVNPS